MEFKEYLPQIMEHYKDIIKPRIGQGNFELARNELRNLSFALGNLAQQVTRYHSGSTFMAAVEVLEERLRNTEEIPVAAMEQLEAYMAQLKLAVDSDNVF